MAVFFGKMEDAEQCRNHICKAGTNGDYFGGMQAGDYAFIRLKNENTPEGDYGTHTHRLWRFINTDYDENGRITAHFDEVFTFDSILLKNFVRLDFFKLNVDLVVLTSRQVKKRGFIKLELNDANAFNQAIINQQTFNAYIGDTNHYRNIVFVANIGTSVPSNMDVQIYKDSNDGLFKIFNNQQTFISGLVSEFNPDRYTIMKNLLDEYPTMTKKANQKKVFDWLNHAGAGTIDLIKLWDLFCSKQALEYSEDDEDIDEDSDNLEENDNPMDSDVSVPLNMILYGPPGTGKTYRSVIKAVSIVEDVPETQIKNESYTDVLDRFNKYKKDGRIGFVTFHQSYGYEDFIEGIKPCFDSDELLYRIEPGVFKAFCNKANKIIGSSASVISPTANVWKVSLYSTGENDIRKDCLKNGYIRIGYDTNGKDVTPEFYENKEPGFQVLDRFINKMKKGDIVLSCYSETTVDAIGVIEGDADFNSEFKEYKRFRKVKWIKKYSKGKELDIVDLNHGKTFSNPAVHHVDISLDDIINAIGMNEDEINDGKKKNYCFVIDEINRGNISKIFGELITLIEPSKREDSEEPMSCILPYSKEEFSVPNNIYLLGTMNTADRSLVQLDAALRRRFEFEEMMPDYSLLETIKVGNIEINKMLKAINDRITVLLDREHQIGHSYFLPLKNNPCIDALKIIFRNKVIPLLQEYFYDDYTLIKKVLNDDNDFIIEDSSAYTKTLDINTDSIFRIASLSKFPSEENLYIRIYKEIIDEENGEEII